jgi:hypothetical protein
LIEDEHGLPQLLPLQQATQPPEQTAWTEDYAMQEHAKELIANERNVAFKQVLTNIIHRVRLRNERVGGIMQQAANDDEHQILPHNNNIGYNHYCPLCWQRYCRKTKHSNDLCTKSQALRNFIINHNNNHHQ